MIKVTKQKIEEKKKHEKEKLQKKKDEIKLHIEKNVINEDELVENIQT